MKVRALEDLRCYGVIKNEEYYVIDAKIDSDDYIINTNSNTVRCLPKEYFEIIEDKEEIKNKMIKNVLENSKTYSIIEIINFPVGTMFKYFKLGKEYYIQIRNDGNGKYIDTFKNFSINSEEFIKSKFYKLEKPKYVTFQEALESGKNVRLSDEYIDNIRTGNNSNSFSIETSFRKYFKGEYLTMPAIFMLIGWCFSSDKIKKIFTEKCWLTELN